MSISNNPPSQSLSTSSVAPPTPPRPVVTQQKDGSFRIGNKSYVINVMDGVTVKGKITADQLTRVKALLIDAFSKEGAFEAIKDSPTFLIKPDAKNMTTSIINNEGREFRSSSAFQTAISPSSMTSKTTPNPTFKEVISSHQGDDNLRASMLRRNAMSNFSPAGTSRSGPTQVLVKPLTAKEIHKNLQVIDNVLIQEKPSADNLLKARGMLKDQFDAINKLKVPETSAEDIKNVKASYVKRENMLIKKTKDLNIAGDGFFSKLSAADFPGLVAKTLITNDKSAFKKAKELYENHTISVGTQPSDKAAFSDFEKKIRVDKDLKNLDYSLGNREVDIRHALRDEDFFASPSPRDLLYVFVALDKQRVEISQMKEMLKNEKNSLFPEEYNAIKEKLAEFTNSEKKLTLLMDKAAGKINPPTQMQQNIINYLVKDKGDSIPAFGSPKQAAKELRGALAKMMAQHYILKNSETQSPATSKLIADSKLNITTILKNLEKDGNKKIKKAFEELNLTSQKSDEFVLSDYITLFREQNP